jgi:hypothetical protein
MNRKGASGANIVSKSEYVDKEGKVGYMLSGASQIKPEINSWPVMPNLRNSLPLMVPECSLP